MSSDKDASVTASPTPPTAAPTAASLGVDAKQTDDPHSVIADRIEMVSIERWRRMSPVQAFSGVISGVLSALTGARTHGKNTPAVSASLLISQAQRGRADLLYFVT